jgi:hypothetical protein
MAAGVNWVRFVGINCNFRQRRTGHRLRAQVTGRPTPHLRRFTGFLQAAWDHRDTLPDDENNGVSPLDSKFGFAWRDWRVLDEQARRTGDPSVRKSADHIARILLRPDAAGRIQGTQDRLHRLHGLALLDRRGHADEMRTRSGIFSPARMPTAAGPGTKRNPAAA